MKKLTLLIARKDMENVLRELIHLGCVEVTEPDFLLDDPEFASLVKREDMDIGKYGANQDSLALLGTLYTHMLTGWMPARSEMEFASVLSGYICAWALEDPSPVEIEIAPVKLAYPQFFGKLRLAGRRPFAPLAGIRRSGISAQEPQVEDQGNGEEQ
jgi:vacuolar-type H+-ATPase subunit I/STV1